MISDDVINEIATLIDSFEDKRMIIKERATDENFRIALASARVVQERLHALIETEDCKDDVKEVVGEFIGIIDDRISSLNAQFGIN